MVFGHNTRVHEPFLERFSNYYFFWFLENSGILKISAILGDRNAFGVTLMDMTKTAVPPRVSTVQSPVLPSHTYRQLKEL